MANLPDDLISRPAGAERAGVSAPTMTRWIAAGLIPGYRIGGRVFVSVADVDALLASARMPVTAYRAASPAVHADMTDDEAAIAMALENGLADLVDPYTTDAELRAYVIAAEAGASGPIDGLREELVRLRAAKASPDRNLVA